MPTVANLRAGLASNLATIPDVQVSAYMLANPSPPAIHIFPDEVEYDQAMGRGLDEWRFMVQALVGLTTDIGAQQRLDLFLAPSGATSIKAAIEADRTLGGAAQSLQVETASGYKVFAIEGRSPVLGAEWRVRVLATGT